MAFLKVKNTKMFFLLVLVFHLQIRFIVDYIGSPPQQEGQHLSLQHIAIGLSLSSSSGNFIYIELFNVFTYIA